MSKDTTIIYHFPCLDGFTSAWVARKVFGDTADYIPSGYHRDEEFPDVKDKTVYFLDYSFKKDKMLEVIKQAKDVIVLDHHISAMKDLAELFEQNLIKGVFDLERSGAGITWDYFFPNDERPVLVNYVEDRDLWRFNLSDSREVNTNLFSYEYDFATWDKLAETTQAKLVEDGRAIYRKHMKDVHEIAAEAQFFIIAGHRVPVVNANYTYGSDIAHYLDKDYPFAAYYWINKNGEHVVGLRSRKDGGADVGSIAESFGGGGHKNAAGFRVNDFSIFERST